MSSAPLVYVETDGSPYEHDDYDRNFITVVVAGDSGCGKTSLLERIARNTFSTDTKSTVCIDIIMKRVRLADGRRAKLKFLDLVGQDITRAYQPAPFHKGADVALAVFDCTRPDTFQSLYRWKQRLNMDLDLGYYFVVVCNKVDLLTDDTEFRRVCESFCAEAANSLNADAFIAVSAKTAKNCDLMVADFVQEMLDRRGPSDARASLIDPRRATAKATSSPKCGKC